jgi:Bromodomain
LSSAKKKALKAVIDAVWKADTFGVFKLPVTKRIAPDYYDIVKTPMDLKTVRQNLDKGAYEDEMAFKHVRPCVFPRCSVLACFSILL